MLPSLWPGDVAEIEACSLADAGPGDIILAFRDDRLFLHRLVTNGSGGFLARGDSMPAADPSYRADALLGKLVKVVRAGEVIVPGPLHSWWRLLGLVCCYCRWVRQLVLRFHRPSAPSPGSLSVSDLTSDFCNREAQ